MAVDFLMAVEFSLAVEFSMTVGFSVGSRFLSSGGLLSDSGLLNRDRSRLSFVSAVSHMLGAMHHTYINRLVYYAAGLLHERMWSEWLNAEVATSYLLRCAHVALILLQFVRLADNLSNYILERDHIFQRSVIRSPCRVWEQCLTYCTQSE